MHIPPDVWCVPKSMVSEVVLNQDRRQPVPCHNDLANALRAQDMTVLMFANRSAVHAVQVQMYAPGCMRLDGTILQPAVHTATIAVGVQLLPKWSQVRSLYWHLRLCPQAFVLKHVVAHWSYRSPPGCMPCFLCSHIPRNSGPLSRLGRVLELDFEAARLKCCQLCQYMHQKPFSYRASSCSCTVPA